MMIQGSSSYKMIAEEDLAIKKKDEEEHIEVLRRGT